IKEYTARDKVVMKLPADQQKAVVYVGKLGAAVEGQTYKKYVAVTAPVAKLDTELLAEDKTKNLVVVGGPCVNREAAAALGLTFPACGADSTIPENAAMIKIVEDYPATGKYTVVVAGWEAANTRTACAVIQQYATLLKDQNVKAIKVTAAETTGITPL
ncbi:MAG: S-layer protein, partial [Candidatus Aenigmatarchaeota archaeon]